MTLWRFITSVLTSVAGLSVFIAFVLLKNYPTAVLGIVTGMLAGLLSHLHLLNYKNRLREWYSPTHLIQMSGFGFWFFTIGVAIFVYFTVTEVMLQKPILPISESLVLPIIWAFITSKTGLLLNIYARKYSTEDEPNLITAEEPAEED